MGSIGFSKHLGCREQILDVSSLSRQAPLRGLWAATLEKCFLYISFCMVMVFGVGQTHSRSFFFIMTSAAPRPLGISTSISPPTISFYTSFRFSARTGHPSYSPDLALGWALSLALVFSLFIIPHHLSPERPKRSIIPRTID